jgi:alkylation response protein AidB-like acyl-CoA dehydrogenase
MEENRIVSALSDKEHECFRQEVQVFAREVIGPQAAILEEKEEFPLEIIGEMGRRGWLGIPIPKEYGGAGLDNLSYAIAVEEISRICGSTGITLAAHTSLVAWPIYTHGTEYQKKKFLIPLAKGEHIGSFGLTENNAGSDAGATETMAVEKGDCYLVNGSKRFITNASFADTIIFTASQDRSKGARGISAFIVEKDTPGFEVTEHLPLVRHRELLMRWSGM